ncbi:MAG: hypothetical protein ACRC62_25185 [Microcoleus sp.]
MTAFPFFLQLYLGADITKIPFISTAGSNSIENRGIFKHKCNTVLVRMSKAIESIELGRAC